MLRSIFAALLLLTSALAIPAFGQYSARTDTATVQLPAHPPNLGGLLGSGMRAVDTDFKTEYFRVTDAAFDPKRPNVSYSTASAAFQSIISRLDRRLVVTNTGSVRSIVSFFPGQSDPAKRVVRLPNWSFAGPFTWSRVNDPVFYHLSGKALMQDNFPADPLTAPTSTLLYDFARCLPDGFKPQWESNLTISSDDRTFLLSLSEGVQNTGYLVLVFRRGVGCRWWNTSAGTVGGDWGPKGTVTTPIRFATIHAVNLAKSGQYAVVAKENCDTDQCPATPLFWAINSLDVTFPNNSTGGHYDAGFNHFLNGVAPTVFANRPYNNLNTPTRFALAGAPTAIAPPFDKHESWLNVDNLDSRPFLWTVGSPTSPFPAAWYNEILVSKIDGSTTWRIGHTLSDFNNQRFPASSGICNFSQSGYWAACSTNWMNSLGAEDGNPNCTPGLKGNCRSDVVLVDVRKAGTVLK